MARECVSVCGKYTRIFVCVYERVCIRALCGVCVDT